VTLRPGRSATAELTLHPDCGALGSDPRAEPALASSTTSAHAVVRAPGSTTSREVPLDVVGDPSGLILTLMAGCSSSAADVAAEGLSDDTGTGTAGTSGSAAVTASGLAATRTGRLSFTLTARGAAVGFTLPMATPAGPVRFTARAHPSLPLTVRPGSPVRVIVDVTAVCRGRTRALPSVYGLLLPRADASPDATTGSSARVSLATLATGVPVEGWDDGVAAAALTAAALRGCR
jgi:hypothetical protein